MKIYAQKKIAVTLALFLAIAGLFSCIRTKTNPVYLNADLKNYFGYQHGTYWVFYDSLNNKEDSLYVATNIDHPPYYDGHSPNEAIEINMINLLDNLSWMLSLGATNTVMVISGPKNPSGGVISDPLTNDWPFVQGTTNRSFDSSTYECTYFPTATVNGVAYNNVYKIVFTLKAGSDTYYINADNGFIGIELNGVWYHKNLVLLRNKIVR